VNFLKCSNELKRTTKKVKMARKNIFSKREASIVTLPNLN
jgi:hypothetical protein